MGIIDSLKAGRVSQVPGDPRRGGRRELGRSLAVAVAVVAEGVVFKEEISEGP